MKNRIGERFGNYRLASLLGRGGFAEVYLAEHKYMKSFAAIKLLFAPITDEDTPDFLKEARTVAALDHPHIIPILDCGVERQIPFLVMKYAAGGTVRKRYPKGSRLSSKTIVNNIQQISDALQYAHDKKIIHRDVKPENMLIGDGESLFLSDFGIALFAQTTQTTQDIIGTWAYMAPEQFLGKPCIASDQYALGTVVYEWICGERPFKGTSPEIYNQHLYAKPPSFKNRIPDLPDSVEEVLFRSLEKNPVDRFPNVRAFAKALEVAYQGARKVPQTFVNQHNPTKKNAGYPDSSQLAPDQRVHPQNQNPIAVESAINASLNAHSLLENKDIILSPSGVGEKKDLEVRFARQKFIEYLNWFLVVLETTLATRFLFKLIGADPNNPFAGFLYALSAIPLLPFQSIIKSPSIHPPNQSFEFSTLIGIFVYYLMFFILRYLIRFFFSSLADPEK